MNTHKIEKEKDEIERVVQDLKRDEGIELSYDEVYDAFKIADDEILKDGIWDVLENTESNEIEVGDVDSVKKIAHMYHKTNPNILAKAIKSGEYDRPMILNYNGNRYRLVAGNTRLCTAKALGINPKVYIAKVGTKKLKNKEIKETGADSSGSFEGPLFGATKKSVIKRKISSIPNFSLSEQKGEFKEATTADVSAAGAYDTPFGGGGPRGRKDPLKIDGPDSIYKNRAVKDKKWPRFGGPKGVYVKVKEKCKKFPYCNQGNTGALEFIRENEEMVKVIEEIAKKYKLPYTMVENLVSNDINKIFI